MESNPAVNIFLQSCTHLPYILLCSLALSTALVAFQLIYNVYFHPLRKYPGPKLAAATGLVYCYNVYKGRECAWPTELHKVYGDVVRLGPDRLSYVSPQAWKDIYGPATGSRIENPKDKNHIGTHFNGVDSLTTIPDTETHRNRRRIFNNAFSEKALRLQEPLIRGYVDQMIINVKKVISKEPNAKFDIVRHFNFITFDVMGDLAFGESLGLLQDSAYTPWVKATFTNLKVASLGRLWREYSVLALIMAKVAPPAMKQLAKSHFENAAERVERRIAQGTDIGKPDFWKLVLEKQEKMDYGLEEMKADASTFMRAGTETTATILSGITFLLLKYPAKMQKVLEEIRSLSKEELTLENLPRLPYFNACITEAFRIYPPASTGIPRCIAKGGNAICGEWVPEGTRVVVTQFAAYHSARNFRDPESFVPERWLPGTDYDTDVKDVFQPFAMGPRNCIGKNLAMHEIRITLASLLWTFDLSLCPESNTWTDQKVYLAWEKPDLLIKAKCIRE